MPLELTAENIRRAHDCVEVDAHHLRHRVEVHRVYRIGNEDAGVVDDGVDPAKALKCEFQQSGGRGGVFNRNAKQGAFGGQAIRQCLQSFLAASGDDKLGTSCAQFTGNRFTNA